MTKRAKLALLVVLTLALVVGMFGTALAVPPAGGWTDLSYSDVGKYGITLEEVGMVSDGYPDGSWRPYINISRGQFVKMAVEAYDIPLKNPATPTYDDVPKTHIFYQWIEGATAAGLTNGVGMGMFKPEDPITREQAAAIIVRWVAQKNGYDPETMYSDAEATAILAAFSDGASVSATLKKEVAFGVDFGVIKGMADGKLAPAANMLRLQGAAMIIRSWAILPPVPSNVPAAIVLVSADKEENLIGKIHTATFKVLDDEGMPVEGALVDFDTLSDPWYVGNVSSEAALTDENGEVTVNLLSTEIGFERVSATVRGEAGAIYTTYVTKYWVVLDEVYILADWDDIYEDWIYAENNAGEEHTWAARVVVYGPGPLSTSRQDFYNAIDPDADYDAPQPSDAMTWNFYDYEDELDLYYYYGMVPRSLAGIPVEWTIFDMDDEASVGEIVDEEAVTDADGWVWVTIQSFEIGETWISVTADYPENPYPTMLLDRDIYEDSDDYWESDDWEPQPSDAAEAWKHWIPHVIDPGEDAPIVPAYAVNNTGEVEEFVLTLEDVYGNPIEGYTVEWWIQGVGFFKTDGSTWVGPGEYNKDVDLTDAAGQAAVWVKSLEPGQTIVHCKVMDKYGLPWKEWNVVKQWYSIDNVEFVDDYEENPVDTGHEFVVQVSGAKYVYTIYDINRNGLRDDKVLIGDREDLWDASGWFVNWDGSFGAEKSWDTEVPAGQVLAVKADGGYAYYTRFADIELEANEFWYDGNNDDVYEVWAGLAGKGVNFFTNVGRGDIPASDDPMDTIVNAGQYPVFVGTITGAGEPYAEWLYGGTLYDYDAVTDDMGYAWVTINSVNKGYQWVYAVADYPANPQDGDADFPTQWDELRWDVAQKLWLADANDSFVVFNEDLIAGNRWVNPVDPAWERPAEYAYPGDDELNPNLAVFAVQVFDEFGNALEGYKVTWEIVGQGTVEPGTINTWHPYAHFAEWDGVDYGPWSTPEHDYMYDAGVGDLNPNLNENPYWGYWADGVHPLQVADADDDNWSWGWTLNSQIDFTKSLDSAAYTTLVLDQTYGELEASPYSHFTSIVNVKIYDPSGDLIEGGEFEVTKVWTLEMPVLDAIEIEQSWEPQDIDWTKDDIVIYGDAVSISGRALDQWGRAMFAGQALPATDMGIGAFGAGYKIQAAGWAMGVYSREVWDLGGYLVDVDGWVYDTFSGMPPVDISFIAWFDADGDNVIDATEITSNELITTFVGGAIPLPPV